MTPIAGQAAGVSGNSLASVTKAYAGNVTSGNILPINCYKWTAATGVLVAGNVTKSAGTATLGAVAMPIQRANLYNGVNEEDVGCFTAQVTGTGSCTIQFAAAAGSFLGLAIDELNSANGTIALKASGGTTSATGNSAAPNAGSLTSGGTAQSAFYGCMTTNNGGLNAAITENAAFTLIFEDESGVTDQPGSMIRRIVSSGVTDSPSWTATSDNWAACGMILEEPAAAGTTYSGARRGTMVVTSGGRR